MDNQTIDTLITAVVVITIVILLMFTFHTMRKSSALEGYISRLRSERMTASTDDGGARTPPPSPAPVPASKATPFDYNRFRLEGTYEETGLRVQPDALQKILY